MRKMQHIMLAVLALVATAAPLQAANFSLPYGEPAVVTISIPQSWNPHEVLESIDGASPDRRLQFFIAVLKDTDAAAALEDGLATLTHTGLVIDKNTLKEKRRTLAKLDFSDSAYAAREEDGKAMKLVVTVAELPGKRTLQVVAWGPPNAFDKHISGINKILSTIRLPKR